MLKYGIEIIQQLHNGILGGPYQCNFSITLDSGLFDISIEQFGIRKITITTESIIESAIFIKLFDKLDMLIMLGEGHFIPIAESKIITNGIAIKSDDLTQKMTRRLKLFNSADFTIGSHSTFLSFNKYLDKDVFIRWIAMIKELDILHRMVLYSMADTGMPIDCKSAFLIESFEALSELIELYDPSFKRPMVKKGESKLGKYLYAIIEKYGTDIFLNETKADLQKVIEVFVNSRNRIAHIKSKQGKKYLNGEESVLYAIKLSFLYRNVLLILLGVDYSTYSSVIIKSVDDWNNWNGVLNNFLARI